MAQQPNLLQGPEPVETAELHFKISCKLKIFESETKYEGGHCCVLAASQYYGLIFAGNLNGFSVIKSKSLSPSADPEKFPRKNVVLNLRPTHLSVDFSQKFLAVVCNSKPGSLLVFYDIQSFKHASKDITALKVIPLSKLIQNLAAEVVDLTWQPVADGSLMICMSDGSVLALSQGAKDGPIFTLPNTTQATCFCWSPKGKQIVIGTASGTLSQYKPDLKLVKTLPPPPIYNAAMVISVLWISSFQFAVAYNDRANPESFPVITIVNAAKNEPVNVINYEDITYSSTLFRNHQIYMTHNGAWNLIFVSSANSIEVAVLHSKDGSSWEQWLLGDASRAELPLNPDRLETFPLGWAFDFTSQEAISWGEGSLPPMPRLLLMSDEGILCVFNVVNVAGNAPQLCAPPKENFDDSLFISLEKAATPPVSEPPKPAQAQKSILGTPPNANSKPTFTFKASPTFGGFGTAKPQVPQGTTAPQAAPIAFQQEQEPQQPQPQTQPQVQPPQQPLVSSTQPSATSTVFKLSGPQFGNTSPFPFGTNSGLLTVKPATTSTVTKTATVTQPSAPQPAPAKPSGDIFAGKTPPQSTPIKKPETPVITTTQTAKKQEEVVETPGKTEDLPAQGVKRVLTPELAAVDDSVYLSALEDEIEHFNSELQQLSSKVSNLNITVGTEEDKAKMKKSIDGLYDFWKELKETTKGQSAEIHTVVMDLMEAFAWLEDAKSRNLQRKNPSYIELKKSEELDPLSARHMSEIGHLKYYIENQLKQLTSYLEKEWMDHQENYRNDVKGRMAVPPLEEVYKTMHFQLKILHKQKTLLEELKEKLAAKKRKNKPQSFLISDPIPAQNKENRVSELSKLAENLLQLKINKEENSPSSGSWEMMKSQLNAISERSKKLTRAKQSALRDALSECDMVKIRPVKTTLESSTFLRSLALEKVAQKAAQLKPQTSTPKAKGKEIPVAPTVQTKIDTPKTKPEVKPVEKPKSEEKASLVKKQEIGKNVPVEKSQIPITVQTITETEEKSPLASLSGIVSSIGKKNETKPQQTFVFGSSSFQKAEMGKDNVVFGAGKLEQKQEKPKTTQTFTFGSSKPGETTFGSKDPIVFGAKPSFGATTLTPVTTKPDLPKTNAAPNVTITTVTTAPTTTVAFTFGVATTTTGFPKMNLLFTGKEQTPVFGSSGTTGNLFSTPSSTTTTTTTQTSVFSGGLPLFGGTKTTTTFTTASTVPLFGSTKTTTTFTTTSTAPLLGSSARFSFNQSVENKTVTTTTTTTTATATATPPVSGTVATAVKPTAETEEVDVVKVDEPVKKPETPEKAKESPKVTVATSIFATAVTAAKTVPEVTTAPSTFSFVTTSQSSDSSSAAVKPVAATATTTATVSSESPATTSVIVSSVATTATTASTFSFTKAATPIAFGQTATTTAAAATTTSIFGTPTTTRVFGQVSSTTPTNIFGGAVSATPTTNIFGGATPTTTSAATFGDSTPTKSIFGQAATPATPATPATTTESLFGASTPTTSTFGQATTPTTPTTFGQKSEVSQATNLFGQLLSDSNRSVYGTTAATSTPTTNIFSTPKNLFGGGGGSSTTASTASLFGTTPSSIFPSVFGQTTTSASVFGQSQTSPSNTFFGQNICFPFSSGTSVTSNQSTFDSGAFNKPIFGQSLFGQTTTNNTSIFGGSSSSSLFGGTSSTTASNVFQTGTTSTTFGSSQPGPFSGGTSSFGENSFGSTGNSFQKPLGGFGSPPVFGGGPAFGGSPTFGGSPSFGSMPTFGSLSQSTFGQSSSGSTTFENFANQNTVGFGNLAQQSQQNQSFRGSGFGSPSFENKPFGGNSFNCWRSK